MVEPIFSTGIYQCKKDSGTSEPNSPYNKMVMSALKKLAHETTKAKSIQEKGFSFALVGDKTGTKVTAIACCAGYLNQKDCVSCVNNTIPLLLQKCPNQKTVVAWRSTCMVRYGEYTPHDYNPWFIEHDASEVKVKDVELLEKTLSLFFKDLMTKLYDTSPITYAFGTQPYGSPSQHLFMTLQCPLDIGPDDCKACLRKVFRELKPCCSGAVAAAVFTPNCYMRYAHHDFRN